MIRQFKTHSLLLLSILFLLIFVIFSYFIWQNPYWSFDQVITYQLQSWIPRNLDLPFSIISELGAPELTAVIIFGLFIFFLLKKRYLICFGLASILLATLIEILTKKFLFHPGPPASLNRNDLNFFLPSNLIQTDFGYPTGRVLRTTFLSVFLLVLSTVMIKRKSWRIFLQTSLICFFMLMLIARVYLGEHWFSDVLGGVLLGTSFGLLAATTVPTKKTKDHSPA